MMPKRKSCRWPNRAWRRRPKLSKRHTSRHSQCPTHQATSQERDDAQPARRTWPGDLKLSHSPSHLHPCGSSPRPPPHRPPRARPACKPRADPRLTMKDPPQPPPPETRGAPPWSRKARRDDAEGGRQHQTPLDHAPAPAITAVPPKGAHAASPRPPKAIRLPKHRRHPLP